MAPGGGRPLPEGWDRIAVIAREALQRTPPERHTFLDAACTDPHTRSRVDSLLDDALNSGADPAAWLGQMLNPAPGGLGAGSRLGRYRIEEKLGAGGMGTVYQAMDERLGRRVALKVLTPGQLSDLDRQRFAHEAKAASSLNHPHIVTIYEYGTASAATGEIDYIAMEYVDGVTLLKIVTDPGTSLAEKLDYARQTALALARAHAAGIVHRDLKPSNIMVTEEGQVKVLDFGLAKQTGAASLRGDNTLTQLTAAGHLVGTPAYMSPEQALGQAVDNRSDIFSFGAVLYELVTGQRAFAGPNPHSILHRVTTEVPTPPRQIAPGLPPRLATLVERCLAKDPAARYGSMSEVAAELAALQPSAAPEANRPAGTSRRILLGALGGGLVAAAGGFYWSQQKPQPAETYAVTYRLMAQQPAGEPYAAQVTDVFQAGWRFHLEFRAQAAGFVYLLNDGPGADGAPRLFLLGALALRPGEAASSGWLVFDKNPGTESVWVVMSRQAVPWLTALPQGVVADAARAQEVRRNLAAWRLQPRTIEPARTGGVTIQGAAAGVAELLQLQHR